MRVVKQWGARCLPHSLGQKIPPCEFESPGYLRLPPLIQNVYSEHYPQTPQMGYLLAEVMT